MWNTRVVLLLGCMCLGAGVCAADSDDGSNTLWAQVDGKKTVLIYSEPGPEYFDKTESYYYYEGSSKYRYYLYPAYATIQGREPVNCRSSDHLVINRSMNGGFPALIFYQFYKLRTFEMTNQNLQRLMASDFSSAYWLTNLNVSRNSIAKIQSGTFDAAEKLFVLDLAYNRIETIEDGAFTKLTELKILYLDHNNLHSIKFELFSAIGTTELVLNNNEIESVDTDFMLEGMQYFDISHNPMGNNMRSIAVAGGLLDISNTHSHTCTILPSMRILKGDWNNITEIIISGGGGNASEYQLTQIKLAHNLLTSVSRIAILTKLETVDLSFNRLEYIEDNLFSRMDKLRWVSLSNNNLSDIDLGLFFLNSFSLAFLDLSYNTLGQFRLNGILPQLEELHVEGNNMTAIDTNIKRMAPRLARLGLNNNDWGCNHLASSLLLLQFDGISPVINASISAPSDWPPRNYSADVKGIRCNREEEVGTYVSVFLDAREGNTTDYLLNPQVESLIKHRLDKIENNLLNVVNQKFDLIEKKIEEIQTKVSQNEIEP